MTWLYSIILVSATLTACISGLFGMAGGMIFMGIIASFMSVSEAMIVHGGVQGISNSARALMLKRYIRWDIFAYECLGAVPAIVCLLWLAFQPSKGFLFLALGILPLFLWLPRGWLQGNAARPGHALGCGFLVIILNLSAGVAGPALDFFYVKTQLTRNEIVATKAVTMLAAHIIKILYFSLPLWSLGSFQAFPPGWFLIAILLCVPAGTAMGIYLLQRFSDSGFRRYSRYIVSLIGVVYVIRSWQLLFV